MKEYVYTAWFRDSNMLPEDQDYEWPACFIIISDSLKQTQEWGDQLSKNYCERNTNQTFLKSETEIAKQKDSIALPKVQFGEEADDEFIGW